MYSLLAIKLRLNPDETNSFAAGFSLEAIHQSSIVFANSHQRELQGHGKNSGVAPQLFVTSAKHGADHLLPDHRYVTIHSD